MMGRDITQTEWLKKRETVLDRDGRQCQDCGKSESDAESLHVHHKTPVSEGGGHELENLHTLCQFCHVQLHADQRRTKGTLGDVQDIFNRLRVPVLKTTDLDSRLGCSEVQARKRLDALVERGFLEKPDQATYIKSDYPYSHVGSIDRNRIVVDGSLIEDGEYIGEEDMIAQCGQCDKYYHGEGLENRIRSHQKKYCSGSVD